MLKNKLIQVRLNDIQFNQIIEKAGVKIKVEMDFSDMKIGELVELLAISSSPRVRLQAFLRQESKIELERLQKEGLSIHVRDIKTQSKTRVKVTTLKQALEVFSSDKAGFVASCLASWGELVNESQLEEKWEKVNGELNQVKAS